MFNHPETEQLIALSSGKVFLGPSETETRSEREPGAQPLPGQWGAMPTSNRPLSATRARSYTMGGKATYEHKSYPTECYENQRVSRTDGSSCLGV